MEFTSLVTILARRDDVDYCLQTLSRFRSTVRFFFPVIVLELHVVEFCHAKTKRSSNKSFGRIRKLRCVPLFAHDHLVKSFRSQLVKRTTQNAFPSSPSSSTKSPYKPGLPKQQQHHVYFFLTIFERQKTKLN